MFSTLTLRSYFTTLLLSLFLQTAWAQQQVTNQPERIQGFQDLGFGQYYEASVQPQAKDQFKSAKYRLWLPPGLMKIKGIIIKQHGCGVGASSHGLNHANDLQWQSLAQKHHMALLGTELTNDELCAQWFNLSGGSDQALLRALDILATNTNHPELSTVPWALWGHSGGGFWCTSMLFAYPERILCAIPRSGGYASMPT